MFKSFLYVGLLAIAVLLLIIFTINVARSETFTASATVISNLNDITSDNKACVTVVTKDNTKVVCGPINVNKDATIHY